MSIYETSITNPKKQLEFYKELSEQLQQKNKKYKEVIDKAIEYIQNNILGIDIETSNIMINREKILDILKESD